MIIEKVKNKIKKVVEAYCCLSPRQRIILDYRYCARKTQDDVAKYLGLSPERIRQLEEQAISIIQKIIK